MPLPQGGAVWLNFIYIWWILQCELTHLFHCLKFQYGGDSQKGPVVSPQEAQAQAILQQSQVQLSSVTVYAFRPICCILKVKGILCSVHKHPRCVFLPAGTQGTTRSTGSFRATRPTGKTLPDLNQICLVPQGLLRPLTSTSHSASSGTSTSLTLLSYPHQYACSVCSNCLWNHCRVAKHEHICIMICSQLIWILSVCCWIGVKLLWCIVSCFNEMYFCRDFQVPLGSKETRETMAPL